MRPTTAFRLVAVPLLAVFLCKVGHCASHWYQASPRLRHRFERTGKSKGGASRDRLIINLVLEQVSGGSGQRLRNVGCASLVAISGVGGITHRSGRHEGREDRLFCALTCG